ncbi:MAG TPA: SLC13 family permease, partial [Candidatus Thermoplasmatota archaeon]|nr:SLC13 family permease [Candidatus Thermoplasmatota archaeon]
GLAVGVAVCVLAFRRDLRARPDARPPPVERITHPALLVVASFGIACALVGFVVAPSFDVPIWGVALASGVAVLLLAATTRVSPVEVGRRFDAGILVFFAGLFVLLAAVRATGLLASLSDVLAPAGRAGYVVATAVLSNVVSNVPAVLLLLPGVESDAQALLLACASTFAGNATFLGSAATVIVAETARAHGASFSVARFTLVGLPIAAITLAMAWWLVPA